MLPELGLLCSLCMEKARGVVEQLLSPALGMTLESQMCSQERFTSTFKFGAEPWLVWPSG